MPVKISATFKAKEQDNNGLAAIERALIDEPVSRRVAVVLLETVKVSRDVPSGEETAHTRLVVIEPMLTDDARKQARALLDEAYRARMGHDLQRTLDEGGD